MLEKIDNIAFSDDDIGFDDIESDIFTVFSDGMGLVTIDFNNIKGAKQLYFSNNLCVVIILFNKGLYKSSFSTYSFGEPVFNQLYVMLINVIAKPFFVW